MVKVALPPPKLAVEVEVLPPVAVVVNVNDEPLPAGRPYPSVAATDTLIV
jgi:hypothetical protein